MIDESSTFGGFLTEIGEAKQSNANALEIPWKLTHMLLGDANGTDPVPEHDQTQLINRVHRAAINQLSVDPNNPAILIAEIVLPPNVGGWWIRELGLEDEDGDFVAVANCAPSYKPLLAQGSGRNQVVRMHLILSNTANVELKIDPSVVLATREYVDSGDEAVASAAAQALQEHEQGRAHPLATETERGMAVKASQTEVNAGDDDGKFVTAKKLKNWATQWIKAATETVAGMLKIATQAQTDAGTDDTTAVTPKKLRWGASYSKGENGYLILPTWLGGLIFQWGNSPNQSSGNGDYEILFPIQFPNGPFVVVGSDNDINSSAAERFWNLTKSSFMAYHDSNGLFWFSVGH